MSLPPRNTPRDYELFMNQYLANLNHDIQNQALVYNAVSANISGDISTVPEMPQDTRSVEEKMRDIDNLKIKLHSLLMSLTDGANANEIVTSLSPELIQMAVQSFPSLYQTLKPIWSQGVPSIIFMQALENLSQKQDQTAGIDFGGLMLSNDMLKEMINGNDLDQLKKRFSQISLNRGIQRELLDKISYVKGLITDRGDLADRIIRAREVESMTGEDLNIPDDPSIINLVPTKAYIFDALDKLDYDIQNGDDTDANNIARNILEYLTLPDEAISALQQFNSGPISIELPNEGSENYSVPASNKPKSKGRVGGSGSEESKSSTLSLKKPLSRSTSLETKSGEATPAGETSQAREERKARNAQSIANASARRDQERIQALKEQEQAKEDAKQEKEGREYIARQEASANIERAKAERQQKVLQAFKTNVSRAKAEREKAEKENERERIKRREERRQSKSSQSLSQKPVEAEPVEAEPVEVEPVEVSSVALGRTTRAIEEGSFEDLLQQLTQNAATRYLALRALEDTGGQLQLKINGVLTPTSIDIVKTGSRGGIGNPATKKYWITGTNIRELYSIIQNRKTSGSGLKPKPRRRTMSGRGISFNIKEDEEAKPSPKKAIKLNIQGVIEKEPSYIPFGRYAINKHRLATGIIMFRSPKGGAVLKLPTQKVSDKLNKILKTVMDKGVPNFEAIGELDEIDKGILHKILSECHITNISTPNPSRDKDEQMYRRFIILRGEIIAGNSNPALAKELKRLIIGLMSKELLPKKEAINALTELTLLEM